MMGKVKTLCLTRFGFNSLFKMARVKFPLPDLGEKIKEGTVKKLYVQEGDTVQEFQKIADVESDKQFTEITAPEVGTIAKIHYQESQACKVGDLFMEIETQSVVSTPPKQSEPGPKQPAHDHTEVVKETRFNNKSVNWSEDILASPVVRMFAATSGVDIVSVKGSGKRNRILKEDIIAHIESKEKRSALTASTPDSGNKSTTGSGKKSRSNPTHKVEMSFFQRGMQKSMTQSNKVPHLYYFETIDVTEAENVRKIMKKHDLKVTLTGILTKTLSLALEEAPRLNSTYTPEQNEYEFTVHSNHNISIAIDSPNGLVVPNIKSVQNLSIMQIQSKMNELKELASKAQLTSSHLLGGTICLSNIGVIAGVSACPLVLFPQTCIIAVGRITEKPCYVGGSIHRKKQIKLGFGCDHRVLEGGSVARFCNQWKKLLENPYIALAKMH